MEKNLENLHSIFLVEILAEKPENGEKNGNLHSFLHSPNDSCFSAKISEISKRTEISIFFSILRLVFAFIHNFW